MKTPTIQDPQLKKLSDMIAGVQYAVLTTTEADGTLHSRPMRTEAMQNDGTLLFFTQANSAKAKELERHSQVSVTYMGNNAAVCVAVAGQARLLRDAAKMKELWKPLYKVWFPQGLEDPELVLLAITIDRAEYWKTPTSPLVRLVGAAKALAQGKAIGSQIGDHEQMTMRERRAEADPSLQTKAAVIS